MDFDSVICFFQALTYFIAPITLSFIALNFWRKNGVRVQGEVSSIQSAAYKDYYHGSILLENLKDRPVNILNIYIMVGNAYYIEVGSYDDEPLILSSYEVKRIDLKPVYAYLINMQRVSLNKIIRSMKSRIIISTTRGRYEVKREMKINRAVVGSLFDRYMAVAQPITDDYAEDTISEAKAQEAKEAEICPRYYPFLSKLDYKRATAIFRIKRLLGINGK
ncbi:hypothetical protein [Marinobacter sp.]|uniref:hypothetical protein n=1 Tax=Marinobacter sp. TaxID=50741 RepID=UPI002B27247E|nr:hypothetical protein [Marinobacter sp.]